MAMATFTMMSCQNNKYSVTAVFSNSDNDGKMVYLTNYDTGETLDSAEVRNKCVRFVGEVEKPYIARLAMKKGRIQFVVEPGDITIDTLGNASGTPGNVALETMSANLRTVLGDTTLKGDSQMEAYLKVIDDTYEANKENPVGYYAFVQGMFYKYENKAQLDAALANAPAYYKDYVRIANQIKAFNQQDLTAEGKMFTDFTIEATGLKLSDYVGKGNYVLVDFWASWCGPCRREIPVIKSILEKYGDKGLTVLGVAVWDKVEDTKQAMEDLKIEWPVMLDAQSGPTDLYGIMGIPHIILFAPDGTIISRGKQGADLVAAVDAEMSK